MNALGSETRPLRVAIVGSGPGGFYAAAALFNAPIKVQVDLFERLPTPFGLVRAGIAPDHPKTRSVIRVFDRLAERDGFAYFGNVSVGRDLTVEELVRHYDAVVFATGAQIGAELGIPGEHLPGTYPADAFAFWYNGHPDHQEHVFDLRREVAVVIGQGNVATDMVRMLALTPDELRKTDTTARAIEVLAESRVREIYLIGRRGPVQAKFTQEEIQELGELSGCDVVLDPADLVLDAASQVELDDPKNFNAKRNMAVFQEFARRPAPSKCKRLYVRFLQSPVSINGESHVESIAFERNSLVGEPFSLKAQGAGVVESLPCGVVFKAIGHRGAAIPGVPFDERRGIFPNDGGRIAPGLYAVGWIKRGPTGLIGTNKGDGAATIDRLLEDLPALAPCPAPDTTPVRDLLAGRGVRVVSYADWQRIDDAEVARGEACGKPREKFTAVREMLDVLDKERGTSNP
jgi:ferredoxin--NADP+ reductase